MDGIALAAALLSALLHASWNAAVKASPQPAQCMTAQMLGSGLLSLPLLLWTGLPAPASWPWMLAATLLNLGAVAALLRSYESAGFGVAYPMARASSVLLVLPLAAGLAGEWPGARALLGVCLVSAAVMLLAWSAGRTRTLSREGLGWILAGGAFVACYVVCDAQGVRRSGSSAAYGLSLAMLNALSWSLWQRRQGSPFTALAAQWQRAMPVAMASTASYLLILWVFTQAPIALGAALRDTSAIFASLIAVVVLKEPFDPRALLAVLVATAGTVLIRLG